MSNDKYYYDAKGRKHGRLFKVKTRRHSIDGRHSHHSERSTSRIVLIVLLVIFILAVSLFGAWNLFTVMGRNALFDDIRSNEPALAESSYAEQPAEDVENEKWEAGWVRYKGETYQYNKDIMTFLFMGIDILDPVAPAADPLSGGQADGLFLLVLDPHTKKISVMAINRNTITDVDMYDIEGNYLGSHRVQICLAHGYGDGMEISCQRAEKAVSKLLYNLPIHGYCSINMGAIPAINDAVGGVTVELLSDFKVYQNYKSKKVQYTLNQGETVTLNGFEAYWYTRDRDTSEFDSASVRLQKQKQYLSAFMKAMKDKVRSNPASALELYNTISPYMVTDISLSEVSYLLSRFSDYKLDLNEIYSLKGTTIPGDEAATGHEEFIYDEEALFDTLIHLFYEKVETE